MARRILGLGLVIAAMALVFAVPASAAPQLTESAGGGAVVSTHVQRIAVDPGRRAGIAYSQDWFDTHPRASQRTQRDLSSKLPYQGGDIVAGAPRVYLVFWGSQWGNRTVGSDGYDHYSGDGAGIAPVEQAFFAGLGTNGELWDGVMTQYCQGVAFGATSCPAGTTHVGYPTGGALAGVWEDTTSASPTTSTYNQLAAEAVVAAQHFGNTTSTSNKNAQYVVISPRGTNPDSYKTSGFCAWHTSTSSAYGQIAFTNMPYLTDVGASCYANSVNSGGSLDGITVVGGHEYAETTTDPFSPSAWWDPTDSVSGGENADKCSIGLGFNGANLTLATGTFAVQSTYGNDANGGSGGCAFTHAIIGGGGTGTSSLSVSKSGTGTGTVTSSPSGISCGSTCSTSFTTGTNVVLTQSPGSGSTFAGWSGGGCSGTGTTCSVTLNAATAVTATFTGSGGGGPTSIAGSLAGWYSYSSSYYFYHQGRNPSYTATVSPNLSGQQVLFTLQRKNNSGVWVTTTTASFALNSSSMSTVKASSHPTERSAFWSLDRSTKTCSRQSPGAFLKAHGSLCAIPATTTLRAPASENSTPTRANQSLARRISPSQRRRHLITRAWSRNGRPPLEIRIWRIRRAAAKYCGSMNRRPTITVANSHSVRENYISTLG
jgi:serine protease